MLINDPNREPCRLAAPEAFSNERAPAELRRRLQPDRPADRIETRSETVARVFAAQCAGDVQPPTAAYPAPGAGQRARVGNGEEEVRKKAVPDDERRA